jgi:hypothetical protein
MTPGNRVSSRRDLLLQSAIEAANESSIADKKRSTSSGAIVNGGVSLSHPGACAAVVVNTPRAISSRQQALAPGPSP